jgi:hypothetical protein
MQRVRIGLTGLAFVFLAVLLAAIFTSRSAEEAPITANSIDQQRGLVPVVHSGPTGKAPSEPLADLGVAPGHAESNASRAGPAR